MNPRLPIDKESEISSIDPGITSLFEGFVIVCEDAPAFGGTERLVKEIFLESGGPT